MTDHLAWETLNDLADDQLQEDERQAAEVHVQSCPTCAASLAALREALQAAHALRDSVSPPDDLWAEVRGTIERRKVARLAPDMTYLPRGWWVTPGRVAAASLILVTLSSAVTIAILGPTTAGTFASADIPSLAVSWQAAERGYQSSVLELRTQLATNADRLAPSTVAAIEQSLATIDVAIAEAREALLRDPLNAALPELLASNYRQKIELLRRATQLAPST
ncbi:MAG TPA: hypothetical protein VF981_17625 [Gemmatimonadaceae bacterium]